MTPAARLAKSIAEFAPDIARLVRASRRTLHALMPTAIEQVYDGYNFLAIGFCTSERTSDCIVSLAVSAKGVALSFYWGATLADPRGILLGSGKQNRFVRLESAKTLARPEVEALVRLAIAQAETPLPRSGAGSTMIKSVSRKRRPRR